MKSSYQWIIPVLIFKAF